MNKVVITGITALVSITGIIGGVIGRGTASHPKLHAALFSIENESSKILRSGFQCGIERWSVKTLSDANADQVNTFPKLTNIPTLRSLAVPQNISGARNPGAETQAWKLAGTHLVAYKEELDSDIHLKLQSTIDSSTMIAEIPDPNCVNNATYRDQIAHARANFVAQVGQPYGYYRNTDITINLAGVGFFDFIHGQNGVAPNGIELHPILTFNRWK